MNDNVYEYKDENNWFLGKWESFNYFTYFGDDEAYDAVRELFHQTVTALQVDNLQIHVVKLGSSYHLVSFLVDMINQAFQRQIQLRQLSGSLLLIENDQLLAVHLPKNGVAVKTFFENQETSFGDVILIATRNEGKTKEFRHLFGKLGLRVENLNDYPDLPDVEETGTSFEENARLKAETISALTGKMVLSDDSGLKVDALGGLPGVWSARFSGPEATDAKNNAKLLHELAMVFKQEDRSAQFHTTLVVAAPGRESLVVEADWPGYIVTQPKGEHGFGYDPLFLVGETGKHAAELDAEEKNKISHRGQAVKKLIEVFPTWQAKQSL
ncbi:nucleoside-triphosphate diphosphatase [Streptococcus ictaluri]|uniref:dITP/XTP pyrophosphatase n=1 Tax=Streptococcus ictaluri 707-05 TaxID=764299 RepID=G5K1E8_9STRE|nr:nucleoside-triphosphate diphosphatase [Streptococcus ictaluri]EHI69957.1 non-canonical purine NTP pyrophosphatase RdgB [Streptococcus ictaluri 707-05]